MNFFAKEGRKDEAGLETGDPQIAFSGYQHQPVFHHTHKALATNQLRLIITSNAANEQTASPIANQRLIKEMV